MDPNKACEEDIKSVFGEPEDEKNVAPLLSYTKELKEERGTILHNLVRTCPVTVDIKQPDSQIKPCSVRLSILLREYIKMQTSLEGKKRVTTCRKLTSRSNEIKDSQLKNTVEQRSRLKNRVKQHGSKCGSEGEAFEVPDGYVGSGTPDVVQLRHPQSGAPAMFLLSPGDSIIQEVLTFSENKRSWFIEDTVKSEGKMHLSTPIDPIFLVLPYLRKSQLACPLDQILKDDEFPETERLLSCTGLKHLSQVADKKGDEELQAYKYSEEKTLAWLARKTERVSEVLKQKGVHVSTNTAVSATFVKATSDSSESYLKYAHGVVSEYLPDDLSAKLSAQLGLPEATQSKRKQLGSANNNQDNKRPKTEHTANANALDLTKPDKVPKTSITAKDKARAKSAAGSKSISSFFKKK